MKHVAKVATLGLTALILIALLTDFAGAAIVPFVLFGGLFGPKDRKDYGGYSSFRALAKAERLKERKPGPERETGSAGQERVEQPAPAEPAFPGFKAPEETPEEEYLTPTGAPGGIPEEPWEDFKRSTGAPDESVGDLEEPMRILDDESLFEEPGEAPAPLEELLDEFTGTGDMADDIMEEELDEFDGEEEMPGLLREEDDELELPPGVPDEAIKLSEEIAEKMEEIDREMEEVMRPTESLTRYASDAMIDEEIEKHLAEGEEWWDNWKTELEDLLS